MHVIRGAWVGQTFALAKGTDSGGKKARIRRSKEERKAMVESFIKRYQKSNDGNFPSLNLTHKEVGGSFYIVREIVREIIQENRVLGPAKLSTEEKNALLEQYPLGSISIEPQIHVLSPEETHVTAKLRQSVTEDRVLDSNGKFHEPEQLKKKDDQVVDSIRMPTGNYQESDESFLTLPMPINDEYTSEQQSSGSSEQLPESASDQFVNGATHAEAVLQKEESEESIETVAWPGKTNMEQLQNSSKQSLGFEASLSASEQVANGSSQQSLRPQESQEVLVLSLVNENLDHKRDGVTKEQELDAGLTQVTADVVESFPLRRVSKIIDDMDERSDLIDITNPLPVKKIDDERLNLPATNSASRNEKSVTEEIEVQDEKEIMDETEDLATHLQGTNESTMTKSVAPEHCGTKEKASQPGEMKGVVAPNGIIEEQFNTPSADGSPKQSIPVEAPSGQNKLNGQIDSNSRKGSSPTLNRINLETWEGKSRKSTGTEPNPLLALFKSFISAFVKFLTE